VGSPCQRDYARGRAAEAGLGCGASWAARGDRAETVSGTRGMGRARWQAGWSRPSAGLAGFGVWAGLRVLGWVWVKAFFYISISFPS